METNHEYQLFKKFLNDVHVTKEDTLNALWLSDIRSAAEIASMEQSRLRSICQDRVLTESIYPALHKVKLQICMAGKNGNQRAIQLLRQLAESTVQPDATGFSAPAFEGNNGEETSRSDNNNDFKTINISGGNFNNTVIGGNGTFDNRGAQFTTNNYNIGGKEKNQGVYVKNAEGKLLDTKSFKFFDNSTYVWDGQLSAKRKMFLGQVSRHEAYPMKGSKNRALLINNYDFQDRTLFRKGAKEDGINLQKSLTKIGFEVDLFVNKTAVECEQILREFAASPNNKEASAVFVFIGSHGEIIRGEDHFLGIDANKVKVTNVCDVFSQNNCQSLKDKPKFFMFQFCRAERSTNVAPDSQPCENMEVDGGDDGMETIGPRSFLPTAVIESDATRSEPDRNQRQPSTTDETAQELTNHPAYRYRDMLMAFCTSPGTKAYRDCQKGSWYVTAFVKVLSERVHLDDAMTILEKVNGQVLSKQHDAVQEVYVQLCEVRSFLHKKLVFFPISS